MRWESWPALCEGVMTIILMKRASVYELPDWIKLKRTCNLQHKDRRTVLWQLCLQSRNLLQHVMCFMHSIWWHWRCSRDVYTSVTLYSRVENGDPVLVLKSIFFFIYKFILVNLNHIACSFVRNKQTKLTMQQIFSFLCWSTPEPNGLLTKR